MAGSSGNHQPLPQSTGHGFRVRNDARHVGRVSNDIDVSLLEVSVVHAAVVVCAFVSSYASFPSGSAVTGGSVPRSSGEFRKEKNGTVAHELYVTPHPPNTLLSTGVYVGSMVFVNVAISRLVELNDNPLSVDGRHVETCR